MGVGIIFYSIVHCYDNDFSVQILYDLNPEIAPLPERLDGINWKLYDVDKKLIDYYHSPKPQKNAHIFGSFSIGFSVGFIECNSNRIKYDSDTLSVLPRCYCFAFAWLRKSENIIADFLTGKINDQKLISAIYDANIDLYHRYK